MGMKLIVLVNFFVLQLPQKKTTIVAVKVVILNASSLLYDLIFLFTTNLSPEIRISSHISP